MKRTLISAVLILTLVPLHSARPDQTDEFLKKSVRLDDMTRLLDFRESQLVQFQQELDRQKGLADYWSAACLATKECGGERPK